MVRLPMYSLNTDSESFLEDLFPGVRRFRIRGSAPEEQLSVYVRIRLAIEELGPTFVKWGRL